MITLRKLSSLKTDTRRRKYPLLLQSFEEELKRGGRPDLNYLAGLVRMIGEDELLGAALQSGIREFETALDIKDDLPGILWKCNSLRHALLRQTGGEPGDWDFAVRGEEGGAERICGEFYLYLDGVRSPFNVGSIFRTAESFGIKKIILSGETCSPEHKRAKRSSMGCTELLPWSYGKLDDLPRPLFALELGGVALESFRFPREGTLIIGSEELGVSPDCLKAADDSLGRLSIATGGVKGSINVSVAAGIALQKWFSTTF